eukprot:7361851-Prymnesium_polylepis.1
MSGSAGLRLRPHPHRPCEGVRARAPHSRWRWPLRLRARAPPAPSRPPARPRRPPRPSSAQQVERLEVAVDQPAPVQVVQSAPAARPAKGARHQTAYRTRVRPPPSRGLARPSRACCRAPSRALACPHAPPSYPTPLTPHLCKPPSAGSQQLEEEKLLLCRLGDRAIPQRVVQVGLHERQHHVEVAVVPRRPHLLEPQHARVAHDLLVHHLRRRRAKPGNGGGWARGRGEPRPACRRRPLQAAPSAPARD